MRRLPKILLAITAILAPSLLVLLSGVASAAVTVYVSPHGKSTHSDTSCKTAAFSRINRAIHQVGPGSTVVVCRGTYHTQAVVEKSLRLIGRPGAVINPKGQKPLKIGTTKLPGSIGIGVLETSDVRVSGFKVIHAGFDAILVALSSHVRVTHNLLLHNGDVGVDLNGTKFSSAEHNTSKFNTGGGFLVADDVGPSSHDVVGWNVASRNPGGCGVIVAGHSTMGVTHILVEHNWLTFNGTNPKSSGAGVVIATEVPKETVADNTVYANIIYGNGLAGVTIHSHVKGQHMSGNRIIDNLIGTNNTVGDPIGLGPPVKNKPDNRTTGILVGASSKIKVLISHNHIRRNFVTGQVLGICPV
jgi:nitrous oxidase accessory protein NosD